MKKFLIGLMLSCLVVFSFNLVGNCMTPQTKESAYLPINENGWFKLEIERQAQNDNYIRLPGNWYKKVETSKTIVSTRPGVNSVGAALKKEKEFSLDIPIENNGNYLMAGQPVVSVCIRLNDSSKSIEEIVREVEKPAQVIEVKFMNIGAGTPYEKIISRMEERLNVPEMDPLFVLNVENFQIISFNIGIYSWGYILAPSMDAPLDKSFIWFTRGGGENNNRFSNLGAFLDGYWKDIELQAQSRGLYSR
ncbi:MAG: hypothetical protein LBL38_02010 [Lactobacillales bacterium]|jgi:hypothetical protein|nr:hypothetical protein [Lactobacillales bacterium]